MLSKSWSFIQIITVLMVMFYITWKLQANVIILCNNSFLLNWYILYDVQLILSNEIDYEHFGISRKGSDDTSDQHCTIFYDKEKVKYLTLFLYQENQKYNFFLKHYLIDAG